MTPPAYGEGSLYQRSSDGRWIASLEAGSHANGKRRRVTVSSPGCLPACPHKCRHRALIKRKLADRKNDIDKAAGTVTSSDQLRRTVKSWVDEWLTIRVTTVRPSTYNVDNAAMRYVLPTIGNKRLVDLTPRDIRNLHAKMRAECATPTVARYHRAVRKMLSDAQLEGLPIPSNVLKAPGPGEGENDRQALDTVQAVAVMHHATDLPHGSRWFVAFYQGLRQGEALGLTWDAIDFDANTITVEWQLQALPYLDKHDRSKGFRVPHDYTAQHLVGRFHLVRPKTRKGWRIIPIVPEVAQALRELRAAQTKPHVGNLVWARPNGWPIDKAADTLEFQRLQDAAKVRHPSGRHFHGHEVRNTTATLLHEAGVDPVIITAILGHSSWATSIGYFSVRDTRLRDAMNQIAAALKPKELG